MTSDWLGSGPRRLLRLVPVVALVTGLVAGCAGGTGGVGPRAAGVFHPATPGVLTVATGTVAAPGFWQGPTDAPDGGLEAGLAHALAGRFGLGSVRVIEVPFGALVAGDLHGADLALSQLTPTALRTQRLAFSTPYLPASPAALVRTGTSVPDVYTAKRLRWAVLRGTTLADALASQIGPDRPARDTDHQSDAVALLQQGQVDAVLLDLPYALALAERSAGALAVAAQLPTGDDFAAALPAGSANIEAVDSAIRAFRSDGTVERLAQRWLGADYVAISAQVPLLRTEA